MIFRRQVSAVNELLTYRGVNEKPGSLIIYGINKCESIKVATKRPGWTSELLNNSLIEERTDTGSIVLNQGKSKEKDDENKGELKENIVVFTEMEEFVWGLHLDEEAHNPEAEDVFMAPPQSSDQDQKVKNGGYEIIKDGKMAVIEDETLKNTLITPIPLQNLTARDSAQGRMLKRGKRILTKSSYARSQYIQRLVDIDGIEEEKVIWFILEVNSDPNSNGHTSEAYEIETLYKKEVFSNVLTMWGIVLNNKEKYKSVEAPLGLFLPVFEMVQQSHDYVELNDYHQSSFMENFLDEFNTHSLHKIQADIVFLPVDNNGKLLLVTFDLRSASVVVFDSKKHAIPVGKKKKVADWKHKTVNVANIAKSMFGRYLSEKRHIKGDAIEKVDLVIGDFKWQTARYMKDNQEKKHRPHPSFLDFEF